MDEVLNHHIQKAHQEIGEALQRAVANFSKLEKDLEKQDQRNRDLRAIDPESLHRSLIRLIITVNHDRDRTKLARLTEQLSSIIDLATAVKDGYQFQYIALDDMSLLRLSHGGTLNWHIDTLPGYLEDKWSTSIRLLGELPGNIESAQQLRRRIYAEVVLPTLDAAEADFADKPDDFNHEDRDCIAEYKKTIAEVREHVAQFHAAMATSISAK